MQRNRREFAAANRFHSQHPQQSGCVCDNSLEPRISCTGSIGRGRSSPRRTLSHLLATPVRFLPVDKDTIPRKRGI